MNTNPRNRLINWLSLVATEVKRRTLLRSLATGELFRETLLAHLMDHVSSRRRLLVRIGIAGLLATAAQPTIFARVWSAVPNHQFMSGQDTDGIGIAATPQSLLAIDSAQTLSVPLPGPAPKPVTSFARLPLSFERNEGQVEPEARFLVRGRGYLLSLEQTEAVMLLAPGKNAGANSPGLRTRHIGTSLQRPEKGLQAREDWSRREPSGDATYPNTPADPVRVLRMKLVGAAPLAAISGEDQLPGKVNYFIGNDPSLWRTNIPTYAKIRYHEVYPGIDLVYYGHEGQLEYDFVVAPGADPNRIALVIEGADKIELDEHGDLRLNVADREFCWHKPKIFQRIKDARVEVAGEYALLLATPSHASLSTNYVAFQVATYDRRHDLVIDPVLSYSTYLGGGITDCAYGIAVDSQGCAYVTGGTFSRASYNGTPSPGNPFPTTTNAIKRSFSLIEAVFVTKFNPPGDRMLYSTVLCGVAPTWQSSEGNAIVVDAAGRAVIAGTTDATDFPRKNALQPRYGGGYNEAFVAKLSPDGAALVFSTFLGGSGYEYSARLALDRDSNIYVAGQTSSVDFPTTNALQAVYGGNYDWYVAKMDPEGTKLFYSTFLGGNDQEYAPSLAVDPAGHAYVAGNSQGQNGTAGIVSKLSLSGSALDYSIADPTDMYFYGIAVDPNGAAYLTGYTRSELLPTTPNAFQRSLAGSSDVFVAKLNSTGSAFEYLTYVGGTAGETGNAITVDRDGNVYVAGNTTSADFPTPDPLQAQNNSPDPDGGDAFVFKLNADGTGLLWSTYLGGSTVYWNFNGSDVANAITLDSTGALYVAGKTTTSDFPVQNAFQSELDMSYGDQNAFQDAFVAKIVESSLPSLQIASSGNTVTISWPVSAAGFHLEVSDLLWPAPNWAAEPITPAVVVDQNVVTIGVGAGSKFFRLTKP